MFSSDTVRLMSELDHARILRLLPQRGVPESLSDLLQGAELLAPRDVPAQVVTMHSHLLVEDPASGARQELTLSYPLDADPAQGRVSVLSPAGTSLLGLEEGETATWLTPDGRRHARRLLRILYQPEASGDYLR
ncbi:MAG: GreA/GreB family elongation factor [Hylemonella sp.]|uniref:GreA/GreB family elongation factor n=1 Tax=Hylemonella sp. TaxID=2066020 RepID=UPI0022BF70C6|nr:GreA/GreB family elongation factor [Hylemonella sp.]MCZ8253518.1 GreA/GreB family elongation factor [Hylemonella sp.]